MQCSPPNHFASLSLSLSLSRPRIPPLILPLSRPRILPLILPLQVPSAVEQNFLSTLTLTLTLTLIAVAVNLLGGDGVIKKGTKLEKTVNFPLEYEVGFDIRPTAIVGEWGSIVHFTGTGNNYGKYGDRIPAVWLHANTYKLYMVDGDTKSTNYNSLEWECNDAVLTLLPNVYSRVRMVLMSKTISVYVNDKVACANVPREERKVFNNVQVYVGDPWYKAAEATLKNLYWKPLGARGFAFRW